MKRAQAMVETLLASLAILLAFSLALRFSQMLLAKTSAEYAAARVARARAVGFNSFMCEKSAKAALIPASGRRLWPQYSVSPVSRLGAYMASVTPGEANGLLEYELWPAASVKTQSGGGISPEAEAIVTINGDGFSVRGRSAVEAHFPLYMLDAGR